MPLRLSAVDIALLESLVRDGRKSFNQISREIKVSAPTVKAHYDRLVRIGLVRSVSLDLDLKKVVPGDGKKLAHLAKIRKKDNLGLAEGMLVKTTCDYCRGPVNAKPRILKFRNSERFFCCVSCKSLFKEKFKSRLAS